MTEQAIKNIERRLNTLAKDAEDYAGSVFTNPYKSYAQGIRFALDNIGFVIEWEDGKAHVKREQGGGSTREVVERLPQNVRATLEGFRRDYKGGIIDRSIIRARAAAYFNGLRDAGLITENERKVLTCYSTI